MEGGTSDVCVWVTETVDHILFSYAVSSRVWNCFKEALGWDRAPANMVDFLKELVNDGL